MVGDIDRATAAHTNVNANVHRKTGVSCQITGKNHAKNEEDAIQDAVYQAAVDTVMVEDVNNDKEDDDIITPPLCTYYHKSDDDSGSEDEDETPPSPLFDRGRYPCCH